MNAYLAFITSGVAIIGAGLALTRAADAISARTRLGGTVRHRHPGGAAISARTRLGAVGVGGILLAAGTSLPEMVASVSAARVGLPEIAAGNLFGSNLFNIMTIALADAVYRKRSIIHDAAPGHLLSAAVGMLLMVLAALGILLRLDLEVLGAGVDALAILAIYVFGSWLLNAFEARPQTRPRQGNSGRGAPAQESSMRATDAAGQPERGEEPHEPSPKKVRSLGQAAAGFVGGAAVIVVAGTLLTRSAEGIVQQTGLSAGFVESGLVAAATSPSEMTTCIAAANIGAINLALGNALGSNLFNMAVLFFADAAHRPGPLLTAVSQAHAVAAMFALLMSAVVLIGLFYRSRRKVGNLGIESIMIVGLYLLVTWFLFGRG
ncbi:MAG: hypothetical protein NUW23_02095 [Firmicutes bacterium]|nr:hypothetical protein [Bacillota bacterium]